MLASIIYNYGKFCDDFKSTLKLGAYNETKEEKFIRIGEYRMNKAVDAIGRLENLANRGSYEYTQEQVDVMFQALEGRVAKVKARFTPKKAAESKTFSFGTTE